MPNLRTIGKVLLSLLITLFIVLLFNTPSIKPLNGDSTAVDELIIVRILISKRQSVFSTNLLIVLID